MPVIIILFIPRTLVDSNGRLNIQENYSERRLISDVKIGLIIIFTLFMKHFLFPLYWFSVPAIMKGWMDRVLAQGFAFEFPKCYDTGFLKNKSALLSFTTGGDTENFSKAEASGDFRYLLWPLQHGVMHFCGFKVLAPQISFAPETESEERRREMLSSWAQRLETIWEEKPINCTPPWYFD
uniref:Flavodoxin-like fold domain-containing protein n=1 Tax=Ornithorhynchus anatinus TaxID=9258 RepID=A0A6I8PBK4_ORNAN